ncbi:hypothetical protein [Methanobrevibacter curvatus]|nr:hypothetical protein [Methanobrevibacter curvatus]
MIKILVGCGKNKNVMESCESFSKINDLKITLTDSEEYFINSYKNNEYNGYIRGSLSSSSILSKIKELNSFPLNRATYISNIFNNNEDNNISSNINSNINNDSNSINTGFNDSHEFLLCPVGIDEGETIKDKIEFIKSTIDFWNKLSKTPKIAILSGGRKEDFGRSDKVDKTLNEAETLCNDVSIKFNSSIGSVKNYGILIEKAIADKNNVIFAPNGIIGNVIFRTLVLVNNWNSYGALALSSDKIFIDTSRDQSIKGYQRSIEFAYFLAKRI